MQLVRKTQFCVVGDYLCYRFRDMQVVWVTKLKQDGQDYIPYIDFDELMMSVNKSMSKRLTRRIAISQKTLNLVRPN